MKEKEKKNRSYRVASGAVYREEEVIGLHQGRCIERRVGKPAGYTIGIHKKILKSFFMVNKKSTSSSSLQLVLPSQLRVDYAQVKNRLINKY